MDDKQKEHLQLHREEFKKIIAKYNLMTQEKAGEIAKFLTSTDGEGVSIRDFAKKYGMTNDESYIFLSFINKGIKFKEEHLDKKDE